MRRLLLLIALACAAYAQGPQLESRNAAYRLQAGDAVEVQYRYTPEFNAKAVLQPDGAITLPITGMVRVGGMTVEEARAAIAVKAGERLRDPEVNLLLTDFVKPSFTVAGEVGRPGRYDLRGSISAIDAVAISGGLRETSKHSQVLLVRRVNSEYADVRILNMKDMMKAGGIKEDVQVRDGDLLIVPQSFVSKLERYVRWGTLYANLGVIRR